MINLPIFETHRFGSDSHDLSIIFLLETDAEFCKILLDLELDTAQLEAYLSAWPLAELGEFILFHFF